MNIIAKNKLQKISLNEAKKVMLDILIEFDHVCKKHGLIYWLDYGTMLGAIRHNGFIPYDDDIDIAMPRSDYEKFLKIYHKELPHPLFLQIKKSDPAFPQYYAKIRNTETIFIEHEEEGKKIKYNQGIFIDIFPVNFIDIHISFIYKSLCFLGKFLKNNRIYIKYLNINIYKYHIFLLNKLHSQNGDLLIKGPEIDPEIKFFEKKDFFPLKDVKFESHRFPVPHNHDKYLTELYGDYMTMLPIEQREEVRHSHEIYKICNQ
jgi:lipopolysaccharide cholinephosphotransferase